MNTKKKEQRTVSDELLAEGLTPEAARAVEEILAERAAQSKLTAGELASARRFGLTARAFIGLRVAHNKITGTDGDALARPGVSDDEAAIARACGLSLEAYREHKAKLRQQLGLDDKK